MRELVKAEFEGWQKAVAEIPGVSEATERIQEYANAYYLQRSIFGYEVTLSSGEVVQTMSPHLFHSGFRLFPGETVIHVRTLRNSKNAD